MIFKQISVYDTVPPEGMPQRFSAQVHAGNTPHCDLWFEFGSKDQVNGITLSIAQSKIERPRTFARLYQQMRMSKYWKINFKTGDFISRRRCNGVVTDSYIFAQPKQRESKEQLFLNNYQSYTEAQKISQGLLVSFDKGIIEHGFTQPHMYEFFLRGRVFKGRYLLRKLPLVGTQERWIFVKSHNSIPFVLSLDAIQQKKLPPLHISALSKTLRQQAPKHLQYWNFTDKEKAHTARIELRKYFIHHRILESGLPDNYDWLPPTSDQLTTDVHTQAIQPVDLDDKVPRHNLEFFQKVLQQIPTHLCTISRLVIHRLDLEVSTHIVRFDNDVLHIYTTGKLPFNKMLAPLIFHAIAFYFAKENTHRLGNFASAVNTTGSINAIAETARRSTDFISLNFAECFKAFKAFEFSQTQYPTLSKEFFNVVYGRS